MLGLIVLHMLVEIDKKFLAISEALTGETQLRAKRTRIKILRAIAEKNGAAGFSDIKITTGLSTGSIYYHLERMNNYVTKDAKHYVITEEGLNLLRESEAKYSKAPRQHAGEEELREHNKEELGKPTEEPRESLSHNGHTKMYRLAVPGILIVIGTIAALYLAETRSFHSFVLTGNATLVVFLAIATVIAAFFSTRGRSIIPQAVGGRVMLSVLSAAAILSGIIFLSESPFSGAAAPHYENSMDALLSSYSLHWQVR